MPWTAGSVGARTFQARHGGQLLGPEAAIDALQAAVRHSRVTSLVNSLHNHQRVQTPPVGGPAHQNWSLGLIGRTCMCTRTSPGWGAGTSASVMMTSALAGASLQNRATAAAVCVLGCTMLAGWCWGRRLRQLFVLLTSSNSITPLFQTSPLFITSPGRGLISACPAPLGAPYFSVDFRPHTDVQKILSPILLCKEAGPVKTGASFAYLSPFFTQQPNMLGQRGRQVSIHPMRAHVLGDLA